MTTTPHRALVIVDAQIEYFEGPLQVQYPPENESLAGIVRAAKIANAANIPVVVVQHSELDGSPIFATESTGWLLHPEVEAVVVGAKRVEKQVSSVFAGTGLGEWLGNNGIDTVTIVGYMANNCDLASIIDAETLGFAAEILSDATGSIHLANEAGDISAKNLHDMLMVLLQSSLAAVATTEVWSKAVASGVGLPKSNLIESALQGRQKYDA